MPCKLNSVRYHARHLPAAFGAVHHESEVLRFNVPPHLQALVHRGLLVDLGATDRVFYTELHG